MTQPEACSLIVPVWGLCHGSTNVRRHAHGKKLVCLEKYLRAYLKVMKFQDFETLYIDAFAGTGEVPLAANYDGLPLDDEGLRFLSGSVRRALAIDESFGQYIFIEKKRSNAKAL